MHKFGATINLLVNFWVWVKIINFYMVSKPNYTRVEPYYFFRWQLSVKKKEKEKGQTYVTINSLLNIYAKSNSKLYSKFFKV